MKILATLFQYAVMGLCFVFVAALYDTSFDLNGPLSRLPPWSISLMFALLIASVAIKAYIQYYSSDEDAPTDSGNKKK